MFVVFKFCRWCVHVRTLLGMFDMPICVCDTSLNDCFNSLKIVSNDYYYVVIVYQCNLHMVFSTYNRGVRAQVT